MKFFVKLPGLGEYHVRIWRKDYTTFAEISNNVHTYEASTVKHPKDKMDKKLGRLIAFKRLMDNLEGGDRRVRATFWEAYHRAEKDLAWRSELDRQRQEIPY